MEDEILDSIITGAEQQQKKIKLQYPITYIFLMIAIGMLIGKKLIGYRDIARYKEIGYFYDLLSTAMGFIYIAMLLTLVIALVKLIIGKMRGTKIKRVYPKWYIFLESTFYCWSFLVMAFIANEYFRDNGVF